MKQAAIKIKNYTNSVSVTYGGHASMKMLKMMLVSLVGLALVYVVVLGNMVWNIIERKSLEAEARNLSNDVAQLELDYLKASSKIDLEFSYAQGFKEVEKEFAVRKDTALSLNKINGKKLSRARDEI